MFFFASSYIPAVGCACIGLRRGPARIIKLPLRASRHVLPYIRCAIRRWSSVRTDEMGAGGGGVDDWRHTARGRAGRYIIDCLYRSRRRDSLDRTPIEVTDRSRWFAGLTPYSYFRSVARPLQIHQQPLSEKFRQPRSSRASHGSPAYDFGSGQVTTRFHSCHTQSLCGRYS